MAKLFTATEEREIRDAIKAVTDTFCDTPILYKLHKVADSRFQEDRKPTFDDYSLLALVEAGQASQGGEAKESSAGSRDDDTVQLMFNLEDLETAGLINVDFSHKLQTEKDYFVYLEKNYRVTDVYFDGPLSRKNVLLIVKGKRTDQKV